MREWMRRFWRTFRERPGDAEMDAELQSHIELLADDLQRHGAAREAAARHAPLRAGGLAQAMERRRDPRGLPWLADLLQDVRYNARMLRRSPGFTAVALLTLTLAIGANTAIFSLVDPLLFRDLPVREPASLVQFSFQFPRDPPLNMFGLATYEQYRDGNHVFSDVFGLQALDTQAQNGEEPISAQVVTGNFFEALGVRPALGRVLTHADDPAGAIPVAVVSWQYWKARLNSDQRVLGSVIDIQDSRLPQPFHSTVVGVAEPAFSGIVAGGRPDIWMSLSAVPDAMRARAGLSLAARLRAGVSIEQARAEVRVLDRSRIDALAKGNPQRRAVVDVTSARTGLNTPLHQQFGGPLRLLMTMVGAVLLLACVNIGSLLLARGEARQHEMSVRVALGAGRFRIVRQVLTESLLLAAIGGLLGVVGARFGAPMLMRIMIAGTRSPGPPPRLDIPLDARVLTFTLVITVLAALLFGLVPAIAAFVSAPAATLRQTGAAPARSRRIFGNGLVVGQVAISLALISVSQLSVAHLRELRDHSLGFDRTNVLLMSVNTSRAKNREQLTALYRTLLPRLQTIPGVRVAAASATTPSAQGAASRFVRAEGFDEPAQDKSRAALNWVSPNYFATFRTPLLAGREFRDDDMNQPRRVIVNEALARRYFAGRDPIGRQVWLENESDPYEIVGVAGDAKYNDDIRLVAPPTVYVFTPMSRGSTTLSLRTDGNPIAVATNARRMASDLLGPDAVQRVTTLADQVDAALVPERLMAMLATFFGAIGALLAAIGLYGLLAYTVARRTTEIGIRLALGATRGDVMRMIIRGALALVMAGMVVGAPLAFWSTRLAAAAIENASGSRVSVAAAGAAMMAVAALAAWMPTRRATRVEPIIALRSE